MPSLLSPHSSSSAYARSYTPLADELNPPYGTHAPTVTRNGTVVYGARKRISSGSEEDNFDAIRRSTVASASASEETLSPSTSSKGKQRADMPSHEDDGDGDIGQLNRGGTIKANQTNRVNNYKGKERAWDEEMGKQEQVEEVDNSYPPVNEVEEEERRIQDNLAKFAARDMARRRAARLSRQMSDNGPAPIPQSPTASSSTTTSFMKRPFSVISSISPSGEGKRASMMGIMGNWMGGTQSKEALPMASPTRTHFNPYDPPPPIGSGALSPTPIGLSPTPPMALSPTSPTFNRPLPTVSPFADPASPDHHGRRSSFASTSTSPPLQSPVENGGYGYVGEQWHGGAAATGQGDPADFGAVRSKPPGGDRWWHALCSWGADLDGGHDDANEGRNQAGRTNPNE